MPSANEITRAYLLRRLLELEDIVASVPVFGKKYNAALDELDELYELLGLEDGSPWRL